MKKIVFFISLWIIAIAISKLFFKSISCDFISVVFCWWFVSYFIKGISYSLNESFVIFLAAFLICNLIMISGLYGEIYHDAPEKYYASFILIMVVHAIFVISPIAFGFVIRLVTNKIPYKINN